MKKILVLAQSLLLIATVATCTSAKPRSAVKNPPAPQQQITEQLSPPPPSDTVKDPYFTGFNGYAWGTPMQVIMRDTKPKTRLYPGALGDFYGTYGPETYETLRPKNGNYGLKRWIREAGFAIRKGVEYYSAAYGKNDGKYPSVIYVAYNGRLVAGGIGWWGDTPPRLEETYHKIRKILDYVEKHYPDAQKQVTPRYNAFNAILQYDTFLEARDTAGMIRIALHEGVGLKKSAPDLTQMVIMSQQYLEVTGQDKEPETPDIPPSL